MHLDRVTEGGGPLPGTSKAGKPSVLFLCEGNAETYDSWSGVSRSVLSHLRALGHRVEAADADLYGAERMMVALRTLSVPRKRWWVRYHLHDAAFRARSRACARAVGARGEVDVLLQVGATFEAPEIGVPLVLYCDSNVEISRLGAASGQSEVAMLTERERSEVREREARVYARAALIFTMSERLRRSFIEDFGVPADRLVTVHCGPNVPVPPPRDEVALTDPGLPPRILFIGRDFERKGGPVLLQAFDLVRHRIPDARLTVVGGRPAHGSAPEHVEYLGYLDRDTESGRAAMDAAYRSATVFCLPTRFEPFGTSFVEAMMYGLPCIGPSTWAVPEIIADGETGTLVPPEDPVAVADALVRILEDPAWAVAMGDAARQRALRRFTWEAMAANMSAALERVVRRDAPATGA